METVFFIFHGQDNGYYRGQDSIILCQENSACNIICTGIGSARSSCNRISITCPTTNGSCVVECSGYQSCQYSNIMCGANSDCLSCTGYQACNSATITLSSTELATQHCTGQSSCQSARITCPGDRDCAISCNATDACQSASFTCPQNNECTINCTTAGTCQSATFTCSPYQDCTINCDGLYSCQNARVTCPTGDYSCNILCTDPLSCSNMSITNTHNVYLQCCGGLSCAGSTVIPSSTECPYIH